MSALTEYVGNPLLRDEWDPLVRAFDLLLDVAARERPICLQTHTHRHGLITQTSPYVQFRAYQTGGLLVEVSGNLVVKPELDATDIAQMRYFGWQLPEVEPDEFGESSGGNPNFSRDIDFATSEAIASWIVTTLVVVYRLEPRDFFSLEAPYVVDLLADAGLLARLTATQSNPFATIFCMPGYHTDMTQQAI
jgi:hypothetical protein